MLLHPGRVASSLVTNLNPQPYPVGNPAGVWSPNYGAGGAGFGSVEAGGVLGLPFYRMTWTTASTEVNRGAERTMASTKILTPGQTYTVGIYVRVGRAQSMILSALPTQSNGAGIGAFNGATVAQIATGWYWHSVTFVAQANAHGLLVRAYASGGTAWAVGDTLDVTAVMVIEGAVPCAYFDGNGLGAAWSGEVGNSTSVTRALQGAIPVSRVAEMGTLLHTQGVAVTTVSTPRAIPLNSPVTLYSAFTAGTTNHRANFLVGGTSHLSIGRNSAGTGWFALAYNAANGSNVATLVRAAGPNVLAAVREQALVTVHSFVGNSMAALVTSWPVATSASLFNASTDVRNTEAWGAAHLPDIRYARMAQIRTTYGIAA